MHEIDRIIDAAKRIQQIALSIVAENEAVLNRRSGRFLRELDGSLHVRSSVPCR